MSEKQVTYLQPMILVIPKSIWKLGFPLQGRVLTSTRVHAFSLPPKASSGLTMEDLDQLFRSSEAFELQIQHSLDHLDTPMVPVKVEQVNASTTGIELSLQITEITPAYKELLDELVNPEV